MMQIKRLHGDAPDHARFARRHLADEGREDRIPPPRDRGDVHEGIVFLQIDVAVRLTERRLGLEEFGVDQSFNDDLGFGRDQEIDGLAAHHIDRRPGEPAGDRQLIEIFRQFLNRGIGHKRRSADHDRTWHWLAARLVFEPMRVDAGAQFDRRIHPEPPRRFELAPIVADILAAGFRIFGNVMAGGKVRRIVETGGGNRHRQAVERGARGIERVAEHADVLAGRIGNDARLDWGGQRLHPCGADRVKRPAKADAVDFRIGGEPRDQNGGIVAGALAVGGLRETRMPAGRLRRYRHDIASAPGGAFRYLC